eukprot:1075505-Alexandrium_andersonii.AAC.1
MSCEAANVGDQYPTTDREPARKDNNNNSSSNNNKNSNSNSNNSNNDDTTTNKQKRWCKRLAWPPSFWPLVLALIASRPSSRDELQ